MQNERDKIVTKTVIHEKNQVCKKDLIKWLREYHQYHEGRAILPSTQGQNFLYAGYWAENRQAGQLHKKNPWEHLQTGNDH